MYDTSTICSKIQEIYPDIGECGFDINVGYDKQKKAYVVDMKSDNRELKTYLDTEDAEFCLAGKQCIGLSIEIAQLKANLKQL